MNIKNKLTIVIPCYNEEKYIENTLLSLNKQIGIKGTNVIIADNNSTDNTRNIIDKLKNSLLFNVVVVEGGNVSVARNNGAKLANTDFILFLDADVILKDPYNIIYNLNIILHNNLDLLTCKIESYGKDWRTNIMFYLFNLTNKVLALKYAFAPGAYFLTRTNKFHECGQFDETVSNSEDFLLSKKYDFNKFRISKYYYGQDDRRFKKLGYLFMIKLLIFNFINRNNIKYFKKDVGYWK